MRSPPPHDDPRHRQRAPEAPKKHPKAPKRSSRRPRETPKTPQEALKRPQDASQVTRKVSKGPLSTTQARDGGGLDSFLFQPPSSSFGEGFITVPY